MSSEKNNFFFIIFSKSLMSLNARWLDYHICFCIQSVALYHLFEVYEENLIISNTDTVGNKWTSITPWWKGSRVSRESLGKSVGSCLFVFFFFFHQEGHNAHLFMVIAAIDACVPKCVKSLDVVNWWYSVIYFKFID